MSKPYKERGFTVDYRSGGGMMSPYTPNKPVKRKVNQYIFRRSRWRMKKRVKSRW